MSRSKKSLSCQQLLLLALTSFCSLALGKPAPASEKEAPKPSPDTVYLCRVDGSELFTNTKLNKTCQGFSVGTVAAKPPAPAAPPPAPGAAAPNTFPKISDSSQKARDVDRKRILEEELAQEQKSLDQAKKDLLQQEKIAVKEERNYKKITERLLPFRDKLLQHERNIEALRKEMGIKK